ncbi:MAG: prolyl aminopeptidase [Pseudomonadota bacterium]|nr:prolyl aminopeptidase [Alteromonas macleodii]MBK85014.1 prolyl aminopeptidase [Gammaproteobacteria bacterium]MEC8009549.1 prolyl aminopeptidase [Pseudomonadota bacterium]|tara:strand:- start:4 stop:972 length:969 start_codon:yes stop_codon:yes gene_type:complete
MLVLFPEIRPYAEHQLSVDGPHKIHIEECGNPQGIPVLVCHGGPGCGTVPLQRRFFDPEHYRIVLFDQRGCGKSEPHLETEVNTTQDLINDMEAIRNFLNIDSWIVFGGSWGATIALVYAIQHPEKVKALLLRGSFLSRQKDLDWLYKEGGASRIFPDAWNEFVKHVPESERDDIVGSYARKLGGMDELARMSAAKAWASWEAHLSTLRPSHILMDQLCDPHVALSLAVLETHYFSNRGFLEPNYILNNMDKLQDIPGVIVHGRYDLVCPLESAFALQKAWPNAQLHVIRDAGHSASEPGIADALMRATRDFATHFGSFDHC